MGKLIREMHGYVITAFVVLLVLARCSAAYADTITLSCTLPTQNEDGTTLTDLEGIRFYESQTTGGPYVEIADIAPPVCNYVTPDKPAGDYYYVVTAYNTAGVESAHSNEATKTIVDPVVPSPPTGLTVLAGQLTAYGLSQTEDVGVLYPVGTVPEGTSCDGSMRFNNGYVVPREAVVWVGTARPLVVFAECGSG